MLDEICGPHPGTIAYRGASSWCTATPSEVLDTIDDTQGDVLYRGASGWVCLPPSTANYLLRTGGAAADPSWVALSTILDTISNTRNTILMRGASAWSAVAVGEAGNVLRYHGPSLDPSWSRGTVIGVSAVAGIVATTGGGVGSFTPAETGPYMVTRAILNTTVKSTGAATIDIGVAANASTSSDNLFDGLDIGGGVVHADNLIAAFAGTNGKPGVYMADGYSVTVTGKADTSGLMGKLFVEYLVLS